MAWDCKGNSIFRNSKFFSKIFHSLFITSLQAFLKEPYATLAHLRLNKDGAKPKWEWELVDEIAVAHAGCEYGEYNK